MTMTVQKNKPRARRSSKKRPVVARPHHDPAEGWQISTEFKVNGRLLSPGVECSIKGERGRYRFQQHVRTEKGVEWLDFIGGPKGAPAWRSFRPERVRVVHRKKTTITTTEAKALLTAKRAVKRGAK